MDQIHIEKVLKGETEAFKYIVIQHKDMAYSLALSIVKNEHDARDVVQEAFIKAYYNLKRFRRESKFSTWLNRIVINEAFKQIKQSEKYQTVKNMYLSDKTVVFINESWDQVNTEEQRYYIQKAIGKLSPKEAMAITLYYMEEQSIDEICNISGLSESHVKILLLRGRKNLYVELSKDLRNEFKTLY